MSLPLPTPDPFRAFPFIPLPIPPSLPLEVGPIIEFGAFRP